MAKRHCLSLVALSRFELEAPSGPLSCSRHEPGVYAPRNRGYLAAVQKFMPRAFSSNTSRAMSSASPFQLPL